MKADWVMGSVRLQMLTLVCFVLFCGGDFCKAQLPAWWLPNAAM
jgi:hypothetical protein